MPTPRRLQIDTGSTAYYHVVSRCVRRAFLCGPDRFSGTNFDHRKQWLVERMKFLCSFFTVDICAYACMSNHFHLVVRIDTARCRALTDEEVVGRYSRLFPSAVRRLAHTTGADRAPLIESWRQRLGDLSWYMRCLNEHIARRANREDDCTGRFWEGRFRSQALLDEGALLTCMSYVDLNPIRAKVANTLEESDLTSIAERLLELGLGPAPKVGPEGAEGASSGDVGGNTEGPSNTAGALVPFLASGQLMPEARNGSQWRWSRQPLPMLLEDYVALLRQTAAAIRAPSGNERAISGGAQTLLSRAQLDPTGFLESIQHFGERFFGMVGQVHRIDLECERRGYRSRRPGRDAAARLYRNAA